MNGLLAPLPSYAMVPGAVEKISIELRGAGCEENPVRVSRNSFPIWVSTALPATGLLRQLSRITTCNRARAPTMPTRLPNDTASNGTS